MHKTSLPKKQQSKYRQLIEQRKRKCKSRQTDIKDQSYLDFTFLNVPGLSPGQLMLEKIYYYDNYINHFITRFDVTLNK